MLDDYVLIVCGICTVGYLDINLDRLQRSLKIHGNILCLYL
jgi:hypothetical protein